jgi:hypothetical protein
MWSSSPTETPPVVMIVAQDAARSSIVASPVRHDAEVDDLASSRWSSARMKKRLEL